MSHRNSKKVDDITSFIDSKKKDLAVTVDALKTHLANAGQEFDQLEKELEETLDDIDSEAIDLASRLQTMTEERDEAIEELKENRADLSDLHDAIAELAALAYPEHPTRVEYIIRRLDADGGPDFGGTLACLRIGHQVTAQQAALDLVAHLRVT